MMGDDIARLKLVLEAAAMAPGNRERFLEAGLIDVISSAVQLSPDWQNTFLKLRPIDKQMVRQSPGLFLADADDVVYRGTTSGSRGQHFIYFAPTEWNDARIRARRQSLARWGISDNTPIVNVASRLLPVRAIDVAIAGQLNQDFIHLLLALLRSPAAIRGYPSRLCEVATHFPRISKPPIVAVICTGECLFEYQQTLLEEVFQAPVINEYGCHETGISGLTCPEAGRLHLDVDRCLYEVIDGQLVTTDLFNHVMPMVRYKCGDIIHLNTDACPCGRPGLTGKILGRIEDSIRTIDGIKRPGEIPMPPLDGILNYRVVRRNKAQIAVQIQPSNVVCNPPLTPLLAWARATFGEVSAQIFWDDTQQTNTVSEHSCDDASWIRSITQESWAAWLNKPLLPKGAARKAALLLKKLVDPAVIVNFGLPSTTQALLYDILDSPPCKEPAVEQMIARVLLFSCNFLADDPSLVTSIYSRAAARLRSVIEQVGQSDNAAIIDLLVPTLFLATDTATAIWTQTNWFVECKLDTFNIHNLLHGFEPAVRRAIASRSNTFVRALKPILSLLIGDLNFFAPRFGVWLLAHWCELMHGQPVVQSYKPEAPNDDFLTAWLAWRRHIVSDRQISDDKFSALQAVARMPEEQARVCIEKGYSLLLNGQELDSQEWLDVIKANAGLVSRGLPSDDIDLMPWMPIVRSLSKPLQKRGDTEMAYQCLVASATPSSRTSAFERLAFKVNDKQLVISDLCT